MTSDYWQRGLWRTVVLASLAATLALAVACGGDEEEPTVTPTSAPAATNTPTPEPDPTDTPASGQPTNTPAPDEPTATPTSAPEPTDTPAPSGPQGTLSAAISNVYFMNSTPFYCPACSVTAHTGATETLLTIARDDAGQLTVEPMIAESWEQSDDGTSYTDFTIREGVQFHGGYGEVTAEDVAFSWNQLNPSINEEAVHDTGGSINTILNEVEVLDERTVRFNWKQFNGSTLPKYVTEFWEGISIFSKDFYDEVGEEGMQEEMIGTGPFEMNSWV
ncbi:MAG: ABC transporter substrate-binding protein, partial [Chloroflexota bacterium]